MSDAISAAHSSDWKERREAGRQLANHAHEPSTHQALLSLLADSDNTAVPGETALALLERQDRHGLLMFVIALAASEGDAQRELAALLGNDDDVDWPALRPKLEELLADDSPAVRSAAAAFSRRLQALGR